MLNVKNITKQMHSDSQKLRRSYLAMQLSSSGDLRRWADGADMAELRPARSNRGTGA